MGFLTIVSIHNCQPIACIQPVCTDSEPNRCGKIQSSAATGFASFRLLDVSSCRARVNIDMALDVAKLGQASKSLSPLPPVLAHGLIPVATFGLLSFVCSTSLFLYLTFRLISWKRKSAATPVNQALFLIYNLLFAGKYFLANLRPSLLSMSCRYPAGHRLPPQHQCVEEQCGYSRHLIVFRPRLVCVYRRSRKQRVHLRDQRSHLLRRREELPVVYCALLRRNCVSLDFRVPDGPSRTHHPPRELLRASCRLGIYLRASRIVFN